MEPIQYTNENNNSLLQAITGFLESIGLSCHPATIGHDTFLPGIDIQNGCILYDAEKLLSPGDLLHEAGHIAVLKPERRATVCNPDISGDLSPPGAELAAIAWSWSAIQHLQIAPEIVFHEKGYNDGSVAIIENFSNKRYFGASLLQWLDMTVEDKTGSGVEGTYPVLTHWLRPG